MRIGALPRKTTGVGMTSGHCPFVDFEWLEFDSPLVILLSSRALDSLTKFLF
jgi:hypothetical protein